MIKIVRLGAAFAIAALTCACSSQQTCEGPQSYQASSAGQPLAVPADLSVPSGEGRLEVPDTGSNDVRSGECLDLPPRFVAVTEELSLTKEEREERDRREFIRNTMTVWAQSWAQRNIDTHIDRYDKRFKPEQGMTRDEFFEARRALIEATSDDIEIRLTEMTIFSTRKKATVRFLQLFTGTGALEPVWRELELQYRGRLWKIVRETTEPAKKVG